MLKQTNQLNNNVCSNGLSGTLFCILLFYFNFKQQRQRRLVFSSIFIHKLYIYIFFVWLSLNNCFVYCKIAANSLVSQPINNNNLILQIQSQQHEEKNKGKVFSKFLYTITIIWYLRKI